MPLDSQSSGSKSSSPGGNLKRALTFLAGALPFLVSPPCALSARVAEEFRSFLGIYRSERHRVVMRCLTRGSCTWAELKRAVEAWQGMTVGQGEITKLLSNLEGAGFVGKGDDGTYFARALVLLLQYRLTC